MSTTNARTAFSAAAALKPNCKFFALTRAIKTVRHQPLLILLCTLALFCIPSHAHADNLGLVGYWSFDEGTGTQATDFSGNGNTGTTTTTGSTLPTWVSGKHGKALSFDGSSNYVDVGNSTSLNPANAITVSAWIYPTAYQNAIPIGRDKTAGGDSVYAFKWRFTGNSPWWRIIDASSAQHDLTLASTPPLNTWTHIVMTYDGTTMNSYVNGSPSGTPLSFSSTILASTHATEIGRGIGSEDFPGKIDDVRIYNRALSATEVAKLYQAGATLHKPPQQPRPRRLLEFRRRHGNASDRLLRQRQHRHAR